MQVYGIWKSIDELGVAQLKLYVSDLDGTLLRNNATLSQYSKQSLEALINNGVYFTVASARGIAAIRQLMQGVPLTLPVIGVNGAYITDVHTGEHHLINSIEQKCSIELFETINKFQHEIFVSTFDGTKDRLYYCSITNGGMEWYFNDRKRNNDHRLTFTSDLSIALQEQVVCLTVINRKDRLLELYQYIERSFPQMQIYFFENEYSPGWYWLTIHHYRASKKHAIQYIADQYGIPKDKVTVFGDNLNDMSMFKGAGEGIAVSNAIAELKQHATKVIGSNEEDSVVNYIINDVTNTKIS